jgi:hypothetical protein
MVSGSRWRRGCVDVPQPFLSMADVALGFEFGEHRAHGGVAGRLDESAPDVLRSGGLLPSVEQIHDFAFAATELFCGLR